MRRKGQIYIFIGAVLITAAVIIALQNIIADKTAEQSSNHAVKQLIAIRERQNIELEHQLDKETTDTLSQATDLPVTDLPDPVLEFPVSTAPVLPDSLSVDTMQEEVIPDYILNPKMEMPTVEIDNSDYIALLEIPTLSLTLPIMAQWSYDGLKIAPGRFTGSLYTNDMVIAGHNYTSHFGTIKDLLPGNHVFITDMDDNVFVYEVLGTEILQGNDVDNMIHGEWDLTIFTCTMDGLQRISVRCRLSAE